MCKKLAVVLMLLALTFSPLYAQETENVMAEMESAMAISAEEGGEATDASVEGNVSLDFRDADIQNVLRILAYKSGVNIVAGPEVTGLVTIKLQDVPWKQALDVILQTYGYACEHKGNIITVTTVENLKKRRDDAASLADQEPLITKTFVLNYAKSSEIITSVEKMVTDRGSVNYDERTNAIIVRDIPGNVELMGSVIDTLDATTPQVLIEAKIVETTLSNTENLGIEWTSQIALQGAERPITWPFTKNSENKYMDDDFPCADDTKGSENNEFSWGTLNFQQFQAVLQMLKTRTDTNILSNPRIVTLDNQEAKIVVGSQYPIPQYRYNEEQATLQVSGFEWKDIGIIFTVTPHVNNAGYVTLDLKPEVSSKGDPVVFENVNLPQINVEQAETSVMIRDGETLVIAGLIKDTVTETKRKVPFFGDIPLLGLLFQKSDKTIVKQDLLIFLTPHIINQEEEASE